jgi:adenylate cyclase
MTVDEHVTVERHPSPDEVRAQLVRILRDGAFLHAGRATKFLQFVVDEALAGRAHQLKGYTIALEVFRRPDTFDAQSDPLVRVEAGRLRHRLMEYYVAAGRNDPVRIDLPRGCYVPQFSYVKPDERGPSSTVRRVALVVVALGGAMLALTWFFSAEGGKAPPAHRAAIEAAARGTPAALADRPRLLVLPLANLTANRDLAYFAYGMTEEIILSLGDFNLLVVAGGPSLVSRNDALNLRTLRETFAADYVLTGSVKSAADHVHVSVRLVDAERGTQLWAAAFRERVDVDSLIALQENIAQQVATTVAVPYGPIFEQEVARTKRKSPERLGTYDCILRFYYYTAVLDAASHRSATECFEQAVVEEPKFADAWGGLALVYLAEYAYGYTPRPGDPILRAREAARTALDIDGQSRFANRAMMSVYFATKDFSALEEAAERVIALSPHDPGTLGLAGTFLAICGQWDRGLALVDRALIISPHPPPWYYLPHVLSDLKREDYEGALVWARKMDTPNWFIAPMLIAATAALAGHDDISKRAMHRLLELHPDFALDAERELAKWNLDDELLETTMRGLRVAGLTVDRPLSPR